MLLIPIFITALIAGLLQLTAHLFVLMYAPKLDLLPRYIIGTLGMLLPASVYLWLTGSSFTLLPIWMCVGASGLAVSSARVFGAKFINLQNDLDELERYRCSDGKTEKTD